MYLIYLIKKKTLLWYNSHTIKFTVLKCTIQWGFLLFFLATLHGLQDPSSPTRDQTHALSSESAES